MINASSLTVPGAVTVPVVEVLGLPANMEKPAAEAIASVKFFTAFSTPGTDVANADSGVFATVIAPDNVATFPKVTATALLSNICINGSYALAKANAALDVSSTMPPAVLPVAPISALVKLYLVLASIALK